MAPDSSQTEVLYGESEKAGILRQLDRLLGDPHLSHSKRFPSFLRFIVQEELDGRGDQLKERTIGVEVFGRDPDYDTTSDPIVRVTATEIRKRIAQYYQDSGGLDELRISLPPGSYVPRFDWPRANPGSPAPSHVYSPEPHSSLNPSSFPEQPTRVGVDPTPPLIRRPVAWRHISAALVLVVLALAGWLWMVSRPSSLDRFWAPVLGSNDAVVVCFPQSRLDGITLRDAANPSQQHRMDEQMAGVIRDDLQPLVSLSGLLEMRHQRYNLMGEDTATLTDLRQGPAIFIGAFDNAWTLRLTRGLRFRFGNDPQMTHFWIEDTQSLTHWGIDRNVQEATNNYRDYAIVARFRDANTGQLAVVAAGIARGGTVAAGEFLTQPGNMEAIKSQAPRNWAGANMEFVLSTEIIDGRSSPPKIEATYFW
jgi:hypothetical protein